MDKEALAKAGEILREPSGLETAIEVAEALYSGMDLTEQESFRLAVTNAWHGVKQDRRNSAFSALKERALDLEDERVVVEGVEQLLGDKELDVEAQLDIVGRFWNRLGFSMPELTYQQKADLQAQLDSQPGKRVSPAPLLDEEERRYLGIRFERVFSKHSFDGDGSWPVSALNMAGSTYQELQLNPTRSVREGRSYFALLYKAPDGHLLYREAYKAALLEDGKGVKDKEGLIWTFPVMDVRRQVPEFTSYEELYEEVDPAITVESLIGVQLLHQATGISNPNHEMNIPNEAVYRLDEHGYPKSLSDVVTVSWSPRVDGPPYQRHRSYIGINTLSTFSHPDIPKVSRSFANRGGVSGI